VSFVHSVKRRGEEGRGGEGRGGHGIAGGKTVTSAFTTKLLVAGCGLLPSTSFST